MKTFFNFLIICLFWTYSVNGQPINLKIDSLCNSLKEEKAINATINSKVIEIEKELSRFKMESSYFSTTLSNQTAIFSVITSGFFMLFGFLFGFFTYQKFKKKVKEYNDKYELEITNYKKTIDDLLIKLKKQEKSIYFATARTNIFIAEAVKANDDRFGEFKYTLAAAIDFYLAEREQQVAFHINTALAKLKSIIHENRCKQLFADNFDDLMKILKIVEKSQNQNIHFNVIEIKLLIRQYIENLNVA